MGTAGFVVLFEIHAEPMKPPPTRVQSSARLLVAAGWVLLLQACGDGGGGSPTSPTVTPNRAPVVSGIACSPCQGTTATVGTEVTFSVDVRDPDGDALTYSWSVTGGEIVGTDDREVLTWRPPSDLTEVEVSVVVTDGSGGAGYVHGDRGRESSAGDLQGSSARHGASSWPSPAAGRLPSLRTPAIPMMTRSRTPGASPGEKSLGRTTSPS